MAGTLNPGDAVTAIHTIVTSDYATKLATVTALYSDSVVLEDIGGIYRAFFNVQVSPWLVVIPVGTGYDYDNTDHGSGLPGLRYHDIQLHLGIYGNHQTTAYTPGEYLELKMERQMLALENTLTAKPKLTISGTDNAARLFIQDVEYVDVATEDKAPLQMRAILNTRIWTAP